MKSPLPTYRPFGDPDTGLITVNFNVTAGDKVTIGGVDFVAGTDFSIGPRPEDTAELLADAINGGTALYGRQSSSIVRSFWAYFIGTYVRVIATQPGSSGITLTETGTSFTVSGATLSGGTTNTGALGTVTVTPSSGIVHGNNLTASGTVTIPIGARDIGILLKSGTGTYTTAEGTPSLTLGTPVNFAGPISVAIIVLLGNPGTADYNYRT